MKSYDLELLTEYNIKRTIRVYDYRSSNSDFIIIEANKINPTDYAEYIYNTLNLEKASKVFLDLTDIYGFNKKNLYEWDFIIDNMKFVGERFISIDRINWNSPLYKVVNEFLASYLNQKIKKLNMRNTY
ncbi:hypothetical protein [Clostridium algidicarnis]|uniref:hypothetical protein n=1 Tax=Clostridium algidicarnis TaxID=37659 RepID=UPI003FD730A6